jgi:hypothetical protein
MIRFVHPGSRNLDPDFLSIPDPGVKKAPDPGSRGQEGTGSRGQKGTGSRIRICNTGTGMPVVQNNQPTLLGPGRERV